MPNEIPAQLTTGVMCAKLGVPQHRVEFYLNSRKVVPLSRVGNVRVFSEETFRAMTEYLHQLDANRKARQQAKSSVAEPAMA
jgi:DNA-binding transcriptional MerR regulator